MTPADAAQRVLLELAFRVEVTGKELGQFAECTGLAAEYEVLEYREGGNNDFVHLLRGRRKHPNLVLKRGVTSEQALLDWFRNVEERQPPSLTVSLTKPDGTVVRSFTFAAAFPIKWTGPNAAVNANNHAGESLEVGHQGMVTSA